MALGRRAKPGLKRSSRAGGAKRGRAALASCGRARVVRGAVAGNGWPLGGSESVARMRTQGRLPYDQVVRSRLGSLVVKRSRGSFGNSRKNRRRIGWCGVDRRIVGVGSPFHLTNKRLRGVLDVANKLPGSPGNLRKLVGAEQEQGDRTGYGHIGDGEHAEGFFPKLLNRTRPGNNDESFGLRLY